jgi:hypothetical protein
MATEKYIITRDVELAIWNGNEDVFIKPNSQQLVSPKVKFKKGDLVDGLIVPNKYQSEPPAYLIITDKSKSDGMFRFANGGRGFQGYDFIEKVTVNNSTKLEVLNGGINPNGMYTNKVTTQGNKTKEPIYYILVTSGVLVAGYFAYKKFKK